MKRRGTGLGLVSCASLALLAVLHAVRPQSAGADAANPTTATTGVYARTDSDHTTVLTPSLRVSAPASDKTRVDLGYSVDVWTSASIDIRTAASRRVTEQRDQFDAALSHQLGDLTLGASYRYSVENDYESHGGSLGGSYDFADHNSTLALVLRGSFDQVWAAGAADLKHPASTLSARLAFTQILDPKMLAQAVYELGDQSGYLSSPYRYVRIADDLGQVPSTCVYPVSSCVLERNPGTRLRHAVALRLRRALGDTFSLGGGYRFYIDDWQLLSHTIEADLAWAPSPSLLLSLGYRFYVQGSASHFKAFYSSMSMPQFYTSDKELSSFTSHRVGVEIARLWDLDASGSKLRTVLLAAPSLYEYSNFVRVKHIEAFEATLSVGVER